MLHLIFIALNFRFVAPLIVGEIISGNNDFKHWQVLTIYYPGPLLSDVSYPKL